jgi:hypothetical protein
VSCVRSSFTCLGQLCTYVRSPSKEGVLGRDENSYVLPCTYTVLPRTLLHIQPLCPEIFFFHPRNVPRSVPSCKGNTGPRIFRTEERSIVLVSTGVSMSLLALLVIFLLCHVTYVFFKKLLVLFFPASASPCLLLYPCQSLSFGAGKKYKFLWTGPHGDGVVSTNNSTLFWYSSLLFLSVDVLIWFSLISVSSVIINITNDVGVPIV